MARYSVNNYTVETLLSNIKSGSIAIPEMQRPFVWDSSKVRDLVDSLYKGFPVGYIIVSKITILICCRERSVSFALRTPPVRSRRRGGCTGHPAIQRRKTYEREI